MAKAGSTTKITTDEKAFEGSGAEGQKGKDTEKTETPGFDKEGATSVVTHRDGLKRVWFRDGKEIGVEDAG